MVEKMKLEKLFVQESRNQIADKTFTQGQNNLSNIVKKFSRAGSRKNQTLEKRSDLQAQHYEVV